MYLAVTNNYEQLQKYMSMNFKVVDMSEGTINPNFLKASLLLPPYEAMEYLIEDRMNEFKMVYFNFLSSPECDYFLSTIYYSLLKGNNIVIYVNNTDNIGSKILMCLGEYTLNAFDIMPEFIQYGCGMATTNNMAILSSVLYRIYNIYELIDGYEFLRLYPDNIKIDDMSILKLANELRPWLEEYTKESYSKFFDSLKIRSKKCIINSLIFEGGPTENDNIYL